MQADATIQQALGAALEHHRAGRLREAEAIYRQVLAIEPNNPDAIHLLGYLAHQVNRRPEALELIRRALALRPMAPDYHHNLGVVLAGAGQLEEAIASWRRTLALRPDDARAMNCIGRTLESMGRYAEAADAHRQALLVQPDSSDSWARLSTALLNMARVQEAADACRRALELDPRNALARYTLGTVLKEQGHIREAIAAYRHSLVDDPEFIQAFSNILYGLYFDPDASPRAIYHEHWLFNAVHARPLERDVKPHFNDRSSDRRLRIGYVSPDFRAHSTSLFTLPLFQSHDRAKFEVFCYSDVAVADVITQQIRQACGTWRDVVRLTDEQAAELIRADRIDILVDLALHTDHGRPLLFARKPAPVQVTWLGYPGTSGLTTMDYRLTDPWIDPPGVNDAYYFEKSVRLPDTMWCYQPVETGLVVAPAPALQAGRITFACLNNFAKVNDRVIDMWAGVLCAVPNSRMLIAIPAGDCRAQFCEAMAARGVAAERIEFIDRRIWLEYMALYHRIDIVLDTFPWNGHTMSLDALWMGVPVVSLAGQTAVSRAGLCYLSNLGMTDLIARTPEEFIAIATALAGDLPRLTALRSGLRDRMLNSPLTDTRRFARNVEMAYRTMWRRWVDTPVEGTPNHGQG